MMTRHTMVNPLSLPLAEGARVVRLRGSEGLAALQRTVGVTSDAPQSFRMDLTIGVLDELTVVLGTSTPGTVRWPTRVTPDDAIAFLFPIGGAITVDAEAGRITVLPEQAAVLTAADPVRIGLDENARVLMMCAASSSAVDRSRRPDSARLVDSPTVNATARSQLRAFLIDFDPDHPAQADFLKGTLLRLGRLIDAELEGDRPERLGLSEMVEAAERLIRADYADPLLDPGTVARRCRVSLRTLQRAVADERGSTLRELISAVRTETALRMVSTSDGAALPLSEIARQCGFSSPERLRRAIATQTGLSPSEYRRRIRAEERIAG